MSWMSDGIRMSTNTRGGLMKGIGRMFAGESLFMATYEAERPDTTIAFASTAPGQILPVDVGANGGLICQKGAFRFGKGSLCISVVPYPQSDGIVRILYDFHGMNRNGSSANILEVFARKFCRMEKCEYICSPKNSNS